MNELEYRLKLRTLQRKQAEIAAIYRKEIDDLGGARDQRWEETIALEMAERSFYDHRIRTLQTVRLTTRAQQLLIPALDPRDEDLVEEIAGLPTFTVAALAELRSRIRKEEHEANQALFAWGSLAVAVLSLLVALAAIFVR